MSDENPLPAVPSLLDAARDVVTAHSYREPLADPLNRLSEAIRVFMLQGERPQADLPLKPWDAAMNRLLHQQHALVRYASWLAERREMLNATFADARYHSFVFDDSYSSGWRLRIWGAPDAKALARSLGGKWKKVKHDERDEPHFDYECECLPGLNVPCTIARAEMLPTPKRSPLDLDLESEVAE